MAVSGRALAQSAGRAGTVRWCSTSSPIGIPGPRRPPVAPINVPGTLRIDPTRLLDAARRLAPGADLVYGSGFEGRPALLDRLSRGRPLYGNTPATLGSVRDPARFFPLLRRLGISHPAVRLTPPARPQGWLVKRPGAAGGTGMLPAPQRAGGRGDYYQRIEAGDSLSPPFSRTDGARWCSGSTASGRRPGPDAHICTAARSEGSPFGPGSAARSKDALDALVAETGLVGLNGLDFIQRRGSWLALELNPRPDGHVRAVRPGLSRRTVPLAPARLRRRATAPRGGAARRACPRCRARRRGRSMRRR